MQPQYGHEQFALTPLTSVWMAFGLFEVLLLFMFKSAMSCYVDNFDSIALANFGLIQIWECALK